ncbi:hypothetical protein GCM10007082_08170 [Oceanisphaera arctica]|nr:hypothetical protein GCM10007082_08170 [Oceanisphaera arctica]
MLRILLIELLGALYTIRIMNVVPKQPKNTTDAGEIVVQVIMWVAIILSSLAYLPPLIGS